MPLPFWQKASVQSGFVAGAISVLGILVAVWLPSRLDAPRLREENHNLAKQLSDANNKVQELQTLLVPFKTVAFQNFTGTEAERLAKLALKLNDIQKGLETLSSEQATIKEKTSGISTLPDGRMKMGGLITGEPTTLALKAKEFALAFDARDFSKAFESAAVVTQIIEDSEKASSGSNVSTSSLNPEWLAEVYRVASDSARLTGHLENSITWAREAIKYRDGGSRRAALVLSLLAASRDTEAQQAIKETLGSDAKIVQEFRDVMARTGHSIP